MTPTDAKGNSARTFLLAVAAFAICSIAAAVRSRGFLEADGGTHYVLARHAFEYLPYLVDVWGRPLCTLLLAIGAKLGGLIGARIVSLCIAVGCAGVAYALALGQQYRRPELAAIFTLGQPLLFLHSFSELTELPFALVVGLALLAYQRHRWGWMTLLAAISPLGRPEGFAILPLVLLALAAHRKYRWILLLPLGLIAWSAAGHLITGPATSPWWRWLIDHWPYERGSEYPSGSLLRYVGNLPMVVGPFALPAMFIGMGLGLRQAPSLFRHDHRARVDFLLAAIPLAVLIGHSLLYWRGMLSSSGEIRYLLVAAPMWGTLSGRGWEWIFDTFRWPRPASWAALAVVATGTVNFYWRVLPIEEESSWQEAHGAVDWYLSHPVPEQYPRVLSNHPGIFYYLDAGPADSRLVEKWSWQNIDHPRPGVLLFWDPTFSVFNADPNQKVTLDRVLRAGWVDDWRAEWKSNVNNPPPWANPKVTNPPAQPKDFLLPDTPMLWHIFRSPVDAAGNPTPSVQRQNNSDVWKEMPGKPQEP